MAMLLAAGAPHGTMRHHFLARRDTESGGIRDRGPPGCRVSEAHHQGPAGAAQRIRAATIRKNVAGLGLKRPAEVTLAHCAQNLGRWNDECSGPEGLKNISLGARNTDLVELRRDASMRRNQRFRTSRVEDEH